LADATVLEVAVTLAAGVVGYLAKGGVEVVKAHRARTRERVARLEHLAGLLHESRAIFEGQMNMARRLLAMLEANHPDELPTEALGYNRTFARLYVSFNEGERDLFLVIRGLTRNALKQVNDRTSAWLRENDDLTRTHDSLASAELVAHLRVLRQHLSEWHALYDGTADDETRSLVFLADEFETGTGFPKGIEELVDAAVERARR
jgi:hypothetical protein